MLRKIFSFATLTLLVALALSSIAAWYSIQGLMAIFAAAVVPIIIMGSSLEIAKVVTTVWLHNYWDRAGWKLKFYLVPAVVALAFLTSMGIFGFLSKAHSDQSLVSGDIGAKVAVYDTKIQTAKDNIDANRKALTQMDAQVDQLLGRTTDDKGAGRAVSVRNQQKKERSRIQAEVAADQETIAKLTEEAAPIRAQIRKVEAEVGPIKYIAAMIYGDNPDSNLLERAVRWVIILIVFVFDPLALALVLAAQSSYEWLDEDLKKRDEDEAEDDFVDTLINSNGAIAPAIVLDNNECCVTKGAMYCDHESDCDVTRVLFPEAVVQAEPVTAPESVSEPMETEIPIQEEVIIETPVKTVVAPDVKTDNVTIHDTGGGYVQYQGKSVSKVALEGMHPELFAVRGDAKQTNTSFGTSFPTFAGKGDVFVRVDMLPNRVYKFDGNRWIEVNKEQTESYLYDEAYIRHLITKIESGEYDPEMLSANEKIQIEEYLHKENEQ